MTGSPPEGPSIRRAPSGRRTSGRPFWRTTLGKLTTALLVSAAVGLLAAGGLTTGLFGSYRLQASDALQPAGQADSAIAVVAIDNQSIAELDHQWPWPRQVHAELIRRLHTAGAELVIYDVLFHPSAEGDEALGEAVAASGNVFFASLPLITDSSDRVLRATTLTEPVPSLAAAAAGIGHSSVIPDGGDGVVRSLPLVIEGPDGQLVESLSLAAFMSLKDLEPPFTFHREGLAVDGVLIPTQEHVRMNILFTRDLSPSRSTARTIRASDVLLGHVNPERLRGAVVFVGATDPAIGDHRPTPSEKAVGTPGVFIHANAMNTLLTGAFPVRASVAEDAIATALLAFVGAAATLLLPMRWSVPVTLAAVLLHVVAVFARFRTGVMMDFLYPPLGAFVALPAAIAIRYVTETGIRRRVERLFASYVNPEVARRLVEEDRLELALRGERLEITVLFCDLRGFTATAADLEPAEVRELLEVFYEETSELVLSHGGTVMQFVGDEVFAVFGAPVPTDDHRKRALNCALGIRDGNGAINEKLRQRRLPPIAYGIGVHSGDVVAAHVGTERHRQYSVIGDTVNCGARLCSLAGPGMIVASADALGDEIPDTATPLARVSLKGVSRDLRPYEVGAL